MCSDQGQLLIQGGELDGAAHRVMKRQPRAERTCLCDALRYPRRALENARQGCDKLVRGQRVELAKRNHGCLSALCVVELGPALDAGGCTDIQCRAMSIRRQTHTCSCS